VFAGRSGYIGFGGHQGVYLTGVGAEPAAGGSMTVIAEIGDQPPGAPEPFGSFDRVAVSGDFVYFLGYWGHPFAPSGAGIYAWSGGELLKVIDTNDILDGRTVLALRMNHRGVDGNQVVFRAQSPPDFTYSIQVATITGATSVEASNGPWSSVTVSPNPFRGSTRIDPGPARSGLVDVRVYDVAGRHVATILEGRRAPGAGGLVWDGRAADGAAAPSGVYFIRLRTDDESIDRRVVKVR
jgi:hypothetical protein